MRIRVLVIVAAVAMAFVMTARGQVIDTSFDAHVDTSTVLISPPAKILLTPDGKMIALGGFNRYNGRNIGGLVRVNADGSLDNSFKNDLLQSGFVSDDEPKFLPDGKILILGTFVINDVPAQPRVIRLNANGTLDNTFHYEPTGLTTRSVVDQMGRVIVLGEQMQYVRNGQTITRRVLRLNSDGSVDDTFNFAGWADDIGVQGNKVVYVVLEDNYNLRRLNDDGSLDNTFAMTSLGLFNLYSMIEQSDHKIVVLRYTTLIRVNMNGGLDNTFANPSFPGDGSNSRMVIMSDNRIVVRYPSTTPAPYGGKFVRMLPSGAPDPSFTAYNLVGEGYPTFDVHPDGSMMIGTLNSPTGTVLKLFPSGQVDTSYNAGNAGFLNVRPGKIRAINVLPSNKILIGGDFDRVGTTPRTKIALLNANSTLDPSFQLNTNPTGNYFSVIQDVYNIERQADGKILVSGSFTYFVSGVQKRNFVRLNPDGSIDPTFVLGVQLEDLFAVSGLSTNKPAYRTDGKIVVANARPANPSPDPHPPVQMSSTGARDTTFTPNVFGGASVIVWDVAVLSSGKILIAGRYSTTVGNGNYDEGIRRSFEFEWQHRFVVPDLRTSEQAIRCGRSARERESARRAPTRRRTSELVRLNADGTLDNTFTAGSTPNSKINAIAVVDDGRIVVGGSFATYNGEQRRNLALLSPDGDLLPRIVDTNKEVLCLTLDNQGRILVGGFFTSLSAPSSPFSLGGEQQVDISYLARLNITSTPSVRAPFDFRR
jgi:uncharacterized delta-60 repeat protein